MIVRLLESRTDPESRPLLDCVGKSLRLAGDRLGGEVEHGHLDSAGDIDTDGVGDDGIVGRQDAPDRESVAEVGIGHERTPDRDR